MKGQIERAWVVEDKCDECRKLLVAECQQFGLPLPTSERISVPRRWKFHECPHMEHGLVLRFEAEAPHAPHSDQKTDQVESETEYGLEGWDRFDASKGIGYPCRELGNYGSYPSHDGFDDESDP